MLHYFEPKCAQQVRALVRANLTPHTMRSRPWSRARSAAAEGTLPHRPNRVGSYAYTAPSWRACYAASTSWRSACSRRIAQSSCNTNGGDHEHPTPASFDSKKVVAAPAISWYICSWQVCAGHTVGRPYGRQPLVGGILRPGACSFSCLVSNLLIPPCSFDVSAKCLSRVFQRVSATALSCHSQLAAPSRIPSMCPTPATT